MSPKLVKPSLMISFLFFISATFAQETCNPIDVMTSPTKKFSTLTGSQYCATSAKIVWKDGEIAGTRRIDYGKSTSYGQSVTLSGSNGTATLSGLTPNTLYYWRVFRSGDGQTVTTPAGSFTTTSNSTGVKQPIFTSKEFSLKIGNTAISFPFNNENSIAFSIISLNGLVIMKKIVSVNGSEIRIDFNKSGTFICKAETKSGVFFNKIVLR